MSSPHHDFASSLAIAESDRDLRHSLVRFMGTSQLVAPDHSGLVASTAQAMTWVIQNARSMYAAESERLVGAICSSPRQNALAVWSSSRRDWIVLSEGLIELLGSRVDDLGERVIHAFPEIMKTTLMQRLVAQQPLGCGIETALGSFLFFGGIAFFTGHEAGHHLRGHDGYYVQGAHAEAIADSDEPADDDRLIRQALERDADLTGLALSRIAMAGLLSKLWEVDEAGRLHSAGRAEFQRVLATLIGAGAMTAALLFRPRKIEWNEVPSSSHPPSVARVVILAMSISAAIKDGFPDLDDVSRRWIRLMCLEVASAATILPGSPEHQIYRERLARGGEPAAIRATGIRRAFNDPRFRGYLSQLDAALLAVKARLKPRT